MHLLPYKVNSPCLLQKAVQVTTDDWLSPLVGEVLVSRMNQLLLTYPVTMFLPGLHSCHWFSLASNVSSVYGPDQHPDSLHRVEASTVVGPENPILEFAAVNASGVPDTVQVGLTASVIPPASFMEMGTVTCSRETGRLITFIKHLHIYSFFRKSLVSILPFQDRGTRSLELLTCRIVDVSM